MSTLIHRLRRRGDEGVTLVEQLVVVAILGVVMIVVFGFLMNATSLTARADANVRAEQAAINGLRTITEDLRSAAKITQCTGGVSWDQCLTVEISKVTSGDGACPKRVLVYRVVSNKLRQTLTDYAANCTTITKTGQRDLIEGVQSTSIFTFYSSDGVTPLNLAGATTAQIQATPAIKATAVVQYRKNVANLTYSSMAALRNNRSN